MTPTTLCSLTIARLKSFTSPVFNTHGAPTSAQSRQTRHRTTQKLAQMLHRDNQAKLAKKIDDGREDLILTSIVRKTKQFARSDESLESPKQFQVGEVVIRSTGVELSRNLAWPYD